MTLDFPLDRPAILFNIEHFLVSLKTYRTNVKKKKKKHSIYQKIWKTQQCHRTGKGQFSFQSHRRVRPKCSNNCTIAIISHASKVISKFSKPGFNHLWTENFQIFKVYLEKAEHQISNCQHPLDHKNIYLCFIDYAKAFECEDHNQLWKTFK